MIIYRIIKYNDSALTEMGKTDWQLLTIYDGKMYFSKKEKETRKKPLIIQEELFYNKNYVKGACSYAFDEDFVALYEEWREKRKLNKLYKVAFDESSEKRVFNKLSKVPKKIAIAMLDNAIYGKRLSLQYLDSKEEQKIIGELKEEKAKEEASEKLGDTQTSELKKKLNDYLKKHKEIYEEAKENVLKQYPKAIGVYLDTLVNGEARRLARSLIDNI